MRALSRLRRRGAAAFRFVPFQAREPRNEIFTAMNARPSPMCHRARLPQAPNRRFQILRRRYRPEFKPTMFIEVSFDDAARRCARNNRRKVRKRASPRFGKLQRGQHHEDRSRSIRDTLAKNVEITFSFAGLSSSHKHNAAVFRIPDRTLEIAHIWRQPNITRPGLTACRGINPVGGSPKVRWLPRRRLRTLPRTGVKPQTFGRGARGPGQL